MNAPCKHEVVDDPAEIRAAFERDQIDLESVKVYRAPDGLYFEVSRTLPCGTVVTDQGLWLAPDEFAQCRRVM